MLMFLTLPVVLPKVIADAKRDLAIEQEKELQHTLQFTRACDWSKAKAGLRPLDLHRLVTHAPRFTLALCERLAAALRVDLELPAEPPVVQRDLIVDAAARMERAVAHLEELLGRRPTKVFAKADLPLTDERKRA